jgi:acetyl-CoA carboxylase carboxyl transferase subunit alpha
MLEHSIYSVISPEGCASILWKDSEKMREAPRRCGSTGAGPRAGSGVIDPDHPRAPGRRAS